jgi:hypothetical protein
MKRGRAGGRRGPARQQPQFLQVQGLQRQPPLLQVQAGFAFSVFVMVSLLVLPGGESLSTLRTLVRSQA